MKFRAPKIPVSYQLPIALAVAFHVLLVLALFIHFPTKGYRLPGPVSKTKVIKAVAVNAKQIDAQVAKIKHAARRKKAAEHARVRRLQAKVRAARRARLREQRRITKLKAEQLRLKKQRVAEVKHLKALKRERRTALKVKQKALQDKLLQQQLSAEKARLSKAQAKLSKAQAKRLQGVVSLYKAQILRAIGQNWLIPGGANRQLSCVYLIQLGPGGVVLGVKLMQSSGNSALDRSARVAIFKASPLPVPKDPALFDNFRELRLTVSPKTVIQG